MNFWKNLEKPILALAPIAGVTDSPYRLICRESGADVVYTEMISIDALYYNSKKTLQMLEFNKKEKPVVLQLFGKRPELLPKAIKIVEEFGYSGIDLNFGCPARKVVAHEGGVSLLKNLDLCRELVQSACESTKLPVSVKTRISIGKGKKMVTVFDFLEKIKDLPVKTLMLHGRSYEQAFSGEPNFAEIKKAKQMFSGIVLANGGINSPEDAKKMLELTGADGIGLARGIFGRPWLFQQIKDYLEKGKYSEPSLSQMKKIILRHAKLNEKMKGKHGIIEMRKHLCWYFRGFDGAAKFREKFVRVETIEELKKTLKEFK
ncbi:tRNA-dihydrouridine synthase [Patescibacteria group bacterium]|nr:tRNA-dihydrouridine synthase [Patescibacteria group bacterium]